jgi:carboxypeptidase Q
VKGSLAPLKIAVSVCLAALGLACALQAVPADGTWLDAYRDTAARIIGKALSDQTAWNRLAELTDSFPGRLAGSPQLESAIAWAAEQMKRDGLDNVRTEPVRVPHWVRGAESARIVSPFAAALPVLGLGGSVGTPDGGIEADAFVVRSFAELEAAASNAAGKIVVYNVPFTAYGETVAYRVAGADRAAKLGAVAVLLRSVGQPGLNTLHTGMLSYGVGIPRIPAAAVSLEDAEKLQRIQLRGQKIRIRLSMEARTLPDADSSNLIAEIAGRENPEEIVVLSGHTDSWDNSPGASDDGGGCVLAWSAVNIIRQLNLRPRRTIRAVLYVNEENGLRGGLAYRDAHVSELANHVLMFESDSGVFHPLGFGFTGNDKARATVMEIAGLLRGIGVDRITPGGGGADIGPSVQAGKTASMSLQVEGSRYFAIHHTDADTVDKIDPGDFALGVAATAVMAYVIADMPVRLGK